MNSPTIFVLGSMYDLSFNNIFYKCMLLHLGHRYSELDIILVDINFDSIKCFPLFIIFVCKGVF